jgi:hypothetical protein
MLILMIILLILGTLVLGELSRGIFSSMYGCSIMYKMIKEPVDMRRTISSLFSEDHQMFNVFDKCYFSQSSDKDSNFYSLFEEDSQESLSTFLGFMDGLKLFHEEFQLINLNNDKSFSMDMISALESYKNGMNYDFDDVSESLNKLNENFSCSSVVYVLDSSKCNNLPATKDTCIYIKTGSFKNDPCISNYAQSDLLFGRLQSYIQAEGKLMDDMLYHLKDPQNKSSVVGLIDKILLEFNAINNMVLGIETELTTHFENLRDGPLEKWLDCGVIKSELIRGFDNMCDVELEDVGNFAMMNLAVILLSFFAVIINFILLFCGDEGSFGIERKGKKEVGYQQMGEVGEDSKDVETDPEKTDEEEDTKKINREMKKQKKEEVKKMKKNKIEIVDF